MKLRLDTAAAALGQRLAEVERMLADLALRIELARKGNLIVDAGICLQDTAPLELRG